MQTKKIRSTTILAIRHKGEVVVAGDGQVTLGTTIIKHQAKKVRRLYNDLVITGFAGSTADAFTLYDRLEQKLEQYNGNLMRAAVELAKDWRMDKMPSIPCCFPVPVMLLRAMTASWPSAPADPMPRLPPGL
jgi:ATP-dependent HslUV protease subunit HslV